MNCNGGISSIKVSENDFKQRNNVQCVVISFGILFVCFSALLLFGHEITEQSVVYLTDNTGTDIPQNLFVQIIKSFWNGSNFFVEIKYKPTQDNNDKLVTAEVKKCSHLDFSIYFVLAH